MTSPSPRVAERHAGHVPVWDKLNAADQALVREIMADQFVVGVMHHAWAMTQKDGRERSFWIYRKDSGAFGTGRIWKGSKDSTPTEAYLERLFLGASTKAVIANYHTHPGLEKLSAYPSPADANLNRLSDTIGFLQTSHGFTAGRTNHLEWRRF